MKYLVRLIALVVVCAALIIGSDVGASPATLIDESVPELVEGYITLPCDFLAFSKEFQKTEVNHIEKRKFKCIAWAVKHDVTGGDAVCMYVEMERLFMYAHLKSVEKALELMCNNDGTQKNPEHRIEF